MKVIDLLNKIAKGEDVPEKIKIYNRIYTYSSGDNDYHSGDSDEWYIDSLLFIGYDNGKDFLNRKIEVIKYTNIVVPKIIKPLHYKEQIGGSLRDEQLYRNNRDDEITSKINEIIDKVNKL